jgi:glyoxylase-like metal-dependent hydrolase (beta-lactamase superfamily II)
MFKFKKMFVAASLSLATAYALLASGAALAAAPMAKTPAPGYFRVMLGAFEITPISDGTVELQVEKLLAQPVAATNHALSKVFLMTPLETSVNVFVVNTGTKLILIDAGAGSLFGPTLGKLVANLKASGYEPAQIDDIFITHLHPDHVGGLVTNGELVFPNAVIHADQRDVDYWLSKENMEKAPADQKGSFQGAMASLNPYIAAKRLLPFNGNTEFMPGVRGYSSYGHTVGHTVYEVESKEQRLKFIGDLIHVGGVQFAHPEVTIEFDTHHKEAAAARERVFNEAARDGVLIGAAHIQFPGLGHLRKDKKGFEWVPVNFTQMH